MAKFIVLATAWVTVFAATATNGSILSQMNQELSKLTNSLKSKFTDHLNLAKVSSILRAGHPHQSRSIVSSVYFFSVFIIASYSWDPSFIPPGHMHRLFYTCLYLIRMLCLYVRTFARKFNKDVFIKILWYHRGLKRKY